MASARRRPDNRNAAATMSGMKTACDIVGVSAMAAAQTIAVSSANATTTLCGLEIGVATARCTD